MLKLKFLIFLFLLSNILFSKSKLFYGKEYGKKVFVEMRDDSTATILIVQTNQRHRGCIYFLEPSEYTKSIHKYEMRFTKWRKNYWITNFMATKKTESINHLPKEKVEIAKKRDWLYIFNLPDISVDFPLKKVMNWEYAREEYERYLK